MNSNWSYSPETPNLGLNRRFLELCDIGIWRMTFKNNRARLLCNFKLCVSFRSHWWIQTGVTVRKRPIWVKCYAFKSRVTLKFDGLPSKTIGHLFYATSTFMHYFVAIGEFELELESATPSLGEIRRSLEPCDIEIWRMTLKNNRAPLLCYFKLCASFRSHWWIQTAVTVRKRSIWVKFDVFRAVWPWNLTDDFQKRQGASSMLLQTLCIIS